MIEDSIDNSEHVGEETPNSDSIINTISDVLRDNKESVEPDETGTREEGAENHDSEEGQPEVATQDTDPEETPEPLLTVKFNGEERQVKQSELIAHYQKSQGVAPKFEELAAQRHAAEAERAQLAQAIEAYQNQLQNVMQSLQPDWGKLASDDPAEYVRQRHIYENWQNQLYEAEQTKASLAEQQKLEWQQGMQQRIADEHNALLSAIPEWKDESKAKEEQSSIRSYLRSLGYPDDTIGNIADHREVLLARKAMMYDNMVKEKSVAAKNLAKKIEKLPPVKVEKPGSAGDLSKDSTSQSMRRLTETGSVNDAARVLFDMFNKS